MNPVCCPICKNSRHFRIWSHENDRFLVRLYKKDKVTYVVCMSCGLAYANPRLTDTEITELYTKAYRDPDDIPEEHLNFKEAQSQERRDWLLDTYNESDCNVLEIGCSEGILLRQLRDTKGWAVTGVEPFVPYANYGIRKWKLDIDTSFFQRDRFSKRFDMIVFMHVIEHIADPISFLEEVRETLQDNGYIYFETPNLWSPKIGRIAAALFAAPHLAIYSPRSVALLLDSLGFDITRMEANLNLRILARKRQKVAQESLPSRNSRSVLHAAQIMVHYKKWAVLEWAFLKRKSIERSCTNAARRTLTQANYIRIKRLYRTIWRNNSAKHI